MNQVEYTIMQAEEDTLWWYRGLRSMIRQAFVSQTIPTHGVILDAGCGTGANLRLFRQLAPESLLIGLDYAPEALQCIPPMENMRLHRGDANALPLADQSVDVVFAGDLLGQSGVQVPVALGHFFRVLKPGGLLLLNVPAFPWLKGEHDLAVHVTKRFLPGELRNNLEGAGFQAVTIRFWNGLLFLPMLLNRLFTRLKNGAATIPRSDLTLTPGLVNPILGSWIEWETRLASSVPFPVGSSIFAMARKPALSGP